MSGNHGLASDKYPLVSEVGPQGPLLKDPPCSLSQCPGRTTKNTPVSQRGQELVRDEKGCFCGVSGTQIKATRALPWGCNSEGDCYDLRLHKGCKQQRAFSEVLEFRRTKRTRLTEACNKVLRRFFPLGNKVVFLLVEVHYA